MVDTTKCIFKTRAAFTTKSARAIMEISLELQIGVIAG
jgi:hypothetical protein